MVPIHGIDWDKVMDDKVNVLHETVDHLKVHETIYLFSFSKTPRYTNRITSAGTLDLVIKLFDDKLPPQWAS